MSTRSRASRERMGEACPRSFAKEPLEDSPLHCEEIFNPFSTLCESPDPRKPSRSAPGHSDRWMVRFGSPGFLLVLLIWLEPLWFEPGCTALRKVAIPPY